MMQQRISDTYWDEFDALMTEFETELEKRMTWMDQAELKKQAFKLTTERMAGFGVRTPSVRVQESGEDVDFSDHVPVKALKDIKSIMGKPLSSDTELPEPSDLCTWWKLAERAISSLGSDICLPCLDEDAVRNLAPVILGEAAYEAIKDRPFNNWRTFKEQVEKRFGLSAD